MKFCYEVALLSKIKVSSKQVNWKTHNLTPWRLCQSCHTMEQYCHRPSGRTHLWPPHSSCSPKLGHGISGSLALGLTRLQPGFWLRLWYPISFCKEKICFQSPPGCGGILFLAVVQWREGVSCYLWAGDRPQSWEATGSCLPPGAPCNDHVLFTACKGQGKRLMPNRLYSLCEGIMSSCLSHHGGHVLWLVSSDVLWREINGIRTTRVRVRISCQELLFGVEQ